jgi:Uma2 family endonuclease
MVDQAHPQQITDDPARNETIVAENVSFEEFLTLYAEQHAEWLMGKVILVVTNNKRHQEILLWLARLLGFYLDLNPIGKLYLAGYPIYISDDQPSRQPDLLIVLNEYQDRLKENFVAGPANFVVEVVSPESSKRDWGDKMDEYEAAGVDEYLLVDPLRKMADIYALGDDHRYHRRPLNEQDRITSGILPGFTLDPALLWRDDRPGGADLVALVQGMMATQADKQE